MKPFKHTHTITHIYNIFVAFLEAGNKWWLNRFASGMKKKMQPTLSPAGWKDGSVRHMQVKNNGNTTMGVFLASRPNRITKLKALGLLVTHQFLWQYPLHENATTLWQSCSEIFWEIPRKKHLWQNSWGISSNKHPQQLLAWRVL